MILLWWTVVFIYYIVYTQVLSRWIVPLEFVFVTQAGSVFSPEVHTYDSCCFRLLYVNVSRFECLPILTLFVQIPNYFINRVNINPNKHCISFTAHNRSASPFIWEGGMLCLLRVMVNLGNLTPLSLMFATTT